MSSRKKYILFQLFLSFQCRKLLIPQSIKYSFHEMKRKRKEKDEEKIQFHLLSEIGDKHQTAIILSVK